MEISFHSVIPILRIFNIAKADEFYLEFLGFKVDWDHRFDPSAPLYRQISRGNLILHLSEHHGDGSPGVHIRVMMDGVEAFQREISAKDYPYMKPGLETMPWGMLETGVIDPSAILFVSASGSNHQPHPNRLAPIGCTEDDRRRARAADVSRAANGAPFPWKSGKVRSRRIVVIAGCSGKGRLTTPKPDGAEVKIFDRVF